MQEPGTTLLFGIGAQKAGTTWVHDWLARHPQCAMTPVKEVHYFDTLALRAESAHLARMQTRVAKIAQNLRGQTGPALEEGIARLHAQLDHLSIFAGAPGDHARYLGWLSQGAAGRSVIGDITPSYALLSRETFAEMAAIAPRTRFLFILRDPVDRLWSAVKLGVEAPGLSDAEFAARARERMGHAVSGRRSLVPPRSNYLRTVRELEAAVPADHILYLFYEDLFSPETVARLASFLGIAAMEGDYSTRSNAGRPLGLLPELEEAALAKLWPQYEFAARRFGETALPARWRVRMQGVAPAGGV